MGSGKEKAIGGSSAGSARRSNPDRENEKVRK